MLGATPDSHELLRKAVGSFGRSHGNDPRVAWRVLDELPPVNMDHLNRWVDTAQPWVDRATATQVRLQSILGDASERPMDHVYPELEKLLESR
jgi:hypothetical protein